MRMSGAWILAGLSLQATAPAQEVPTFRAEVRRVFVDAFVTRDGKAVLGLSANDFELHDNGVPQRVQLVAIETLPLSLLLVLDVSGSLTDEERAALVDAARALVDGLSPGDEVGLLTAAHRLERPLPLTRDLSALPGALAEASSGGATAIRDATFAGLTLLSGGRGRPLLIVLTDGRDNASWLREEDLLEAAGASEAIVYVLAPRSSSSSGPRRRFRGLAFRRENVVPSLPVEGLPFFERLARRAGGDVLFADGRGELAEAYTMLLAEMRTRYLLVYEPRGVSPEGWHDLEVQVRRERYELRARAGYWAER